MAVFAFSRFKPARARPNAPTIISGPPWRGANLLTQAILSAQAAGRLVKVAWQEVADELPSYGKHVLQQMRLLGPSHPFIMSEYCVELRSARRTARGRDVEQV